VIRTVSRRDAQERFGALLDSLQEEDDTVVVEADGTMLAAMIGPAEYERYREFVRQQAVETVNRVRERNADKDPEEVLRDVTEIVEDVRRDRRERN
jgi:PHD/YefM family antitoxin component YafN of YafNO toxin-antitoxin module